MQPSTLRRTFALTFAGLLLSTGCASEPPDAARDDDEDTTDDREDDNDEDQSPASGKDGGGGKDSGSTGGGNTSGSGGGKDSGSTGSGGGKDSGSTSGGNTSGSGSGKCKLVPNEDGWIAEDSNDAKLQGSFYTYASDGSTIDPLTSASSPFETAGDGKLCVKGSAAVVVDMMYSKYFGAGMAFDVCAAAGSTGAASGKRTLSECPSAADMLGIKFKLSGKTIPAELRVTFHEAMRDESTYVLAKEGANEALIAKATVAYATTPAPAANTGKIDSIHFAIPTNTSDETPFDFCVEDIQVLTKTGACGDGSGSTGSGGTGGSDAGKNDAGAGSGSDGDAGSNGGSDSGTGSTGGNTGGGTCSKSGAWTSSDKFATKAYGKYMLRNNVWQSNTQGLGNQTIWGNSPKCWGVDANHTDPAGAKGNVKSYPNVMRGWSIQAPATANHGLNIRVSDIQKAKIRWKFQAPASGRMWALWDIYFHETANPPYNSPAKAPVNLMIQQYVVDQTGWFQGPQHSGSWPKVTIDGVAYREAFNDSPQSFSRDQIKLYVDGESGATMGKKELTIDLKQIIDAYVAKGKIKSTDYLTGIQAGFEIVEGGTYVVEDFWTAINDEPEGN